MNNKSKYTFLTYLFLLLTIFVAFLLTKDMYFEVLENSKQKELLQEKLTAKNEELQKISKIKTDIDSWKINNKQLNKFLSKFSEDELTDYFYNYANLNKTKVKIESISLTEWKLNEFWFTESKIDLTATFWQEQDMLDMINFLLTSDKYNLFIHEFSYPFGHTEGAFKVSIPLKVLYKN